MSKYRPFKSFKTPTERPFKAYNPANPANNTSMLFQDSQQEQPLRLGLINGLMQQQQQQQHQQQQQQQQQLMSFAQQQQNNPVQQVYGDPEDYLQMNPEQRGQNPIMNIDPSLTAYYEELGLDDPDNPLIRPELLVTNDSILQREQDLNIVGQSSNPMSITPSFLLPNRHHQRGPGGNSMAASSGSMQDSLSMLFDQSQSPLNPFSSPLQQQQQLHHQLLAKTNTDNRSSSDIHGANGSHFMGSLPTASQSSALSMMGGNGDQNGNGHATMAVDILPTSSGLNVESFPIKQEADEGRALTDDSPSPSSIQSPSQSDSFGESPKRNLKRTISDGSNCSAANQDSVKKDSKMVDSGDNSDSQRDPAYLEKRRKNNESAKRSREARRNKEELVALRVITLEEENMKLRAEISLLDKELDELRARLFT